MSPSSKPAKSGRTFWRPFQRQMSCAPICVLPGNRWIFQMIISSGLAPEPFSEPAKKSCFLRWKLGIDKPPGTAIRLFEAIVPSIDAGQEARITVCVCKGPIDASFKTVIYPASAVIPSRSSSASPQKPKAEHRTAGRAESAPALIAAKPVKPCDGGVFEALNLLLKTEQKPARAIPVQRRSAGGLLRLETGRFTGRLSMPA